MFTKKTFLAGLVAGAALFAGSAAMAECNHRIPAGSYVTQNSPQHVNSIQISHGCVGDSTMYGIQFTGCGGFCTGPLFPVENAASRIRASIAGGAVDLFIERMGGNRIRVTYNSAAYPQYNYTDVLRLN